jgi:hypothetical protein
MILFKKSKFLSHARVAVLLIRIFSKPPLLITAYGHPKSVQLPGSHSKEMKELVARWIYKDMRPFAIEDDASFREIAFYMWNEIDYSSLEKREETV